MILDERMEQSECLYHFFPKRDALNLYQLIDLFPNYYILEVADISLFKPDSNLFLVNIFNLRS